MKRQIEIDVRPTPYELAEVFCNMCDYEQAQFFNEVGNISDEWDSPFVMQLQSIVNTKLLTKSGNQVMAEIGDYAFRWK